jgi:sugar phosphate isomerase/epimerase
MALFEASSFKIQKNPEHFLKENQILKLTAYAHNLEGLRNLEKMGFEFCAIHPMWLPKLDLGIIPSDQAVASVKSAISESSVKPIDLVIFGGWHALALSGAIDQVPASPTEPIHEEIRKKGVEEFKKIIEIAKELGCKQILSELGGRQVYHFDSEEAWRKSVKDLDPVLGEKGIKLAFMPHPGDFEIENNRFVDLLLDTKAKNLGYVYVAPHTFILSGRYDANAGEMIEYAHNSGLLTEIHLADSLMPIQMWVIQHREVYPYHSHLPIGKGMVDIKGILKAMKKIDFQGPVLLMPYRYGWHTKSFSELQLEAKQSVEQMLAEIKRENE